MAASYHTIAQRLSALSELVRHARVYEEAGRLFAEITPDLDACKAAHVINIRNELQWYAVERYNLDPLDGRRIEGFSIVTSPVCHRYDHTGDTVYIQLQHYLEEQSGRAVYPSSHIELDLDLDSLGYVMLFSFIDATFGVAVDEATFSAHMEVRSLADYIRMHQHGSVHPVPGWSELLRRPMAKALKHSPVALGIYQTLCRPLYRLFFDMQVHGLDNLPQNGCVIAPSHQSMLDGFIIAAFLPRQVLKHTFFLAYEGEFGKWFMRPVANHGQLILIDNNKNLLKSIQMTAQPLKADENVVIFPEGARTRDRQLLPFKPMYAMLAKEFALPIVPIRLDGTFESLPAGRLWPKRSRVVMEVLPAVSTEAKEVDQLNDEVKGVIDAAMRRSPLV
jgi:long-chain acyl-CoA synthetase